jgi:hypothetical protein
MSSVLHYQHIAGKKYTIMVNGPVSGLIDV